MCVGMLILRGYGFGRIGFWAKEPGGLGWFELDGLDCAKLWVG
jgi:hypothetical protein